MAGGLGFHESSRLGYEPCHVYPSPLALLHHLAGIEPATFPCKGTLYQLSYKGSNSASTCVSKTFREGS